MRIKQEIYVAGHRSAILREFKKKGQTNIMVHTHAELELTDQPAVRFL